MSASDAVCASRPRNISCLAAWSSSIDDWARAAPTLRVIHPRSSYTRSTCSYTVLCMFALGWQPQWATNIFLSLQLFHLCVSHKKCIDFCTYDAQLPPFTVCSSSLIAQIEASRINCDATWRPRQRQGSTESKWTLEMIASYRARARLWNSFHFHQFGVS